MGTKIPHSILINDLLAIEIKFVSDNVGMTTNINFSVKEIMDQNGKWNSRLSYKPKHEGLEGTRSKHEVFTHQRLNIYRVTSSLVEKKPDRIALVIGTNDMLSEKLPVISKSLILEALSDCNVIVSEVTFIKSENKPFSYSTKEPASSFIYIQSYSQGSIEWR